MSPTPEHDDERRHGEHQHGQAQDGQSVGRSESGRATNGMVIPLPRRALAQRPAARQNGRHGGLEKSDPAAGARKRMPRDPIPHGASEICGVRVWGLPALRMSGGVIRMRVEEPPAQRPRPKLVYSAACALTDEPRDG
ncbi:hypothetical protein [Azospirillum brasilense]|uniref:hypothetical protein n=1 Tax=Azospirillum brasilense TaxID=192 RepID=UPI000E68EA9C|nr:hypothetical protein [Azospirillum brasilense]NUB28522.1 hypothetical protein [Azospirillum brasilense]NUB35689.1 hypothetical protein [Azospirillum brasilense]RIV96723.1 hypothetical protein D2T81_30710 [Azospirillum brasilense]